MLAVDLTICDVNADHPTQKAFQFDREQDNLILRWIVQKTRQAEGALSIGDWDEFLEQVRKRETHRWLTAQQFEGPMGDGGLPSIMGQLSTTPAYQLFLAGMDVAGFLGLYQTGTPEQQHFLPHNVSRRFGELSGFIPTLVGGGKLFFPSDDLLAGREAAAEKLLQNGKLGKVTAIVEDASVPGSKYYVPYSVPSGSMTNVNQAAKGLWDSVRRDYYAQRG